MSRKIYFISHNDFAKGLKRSVEMIAGKQPNVTAYGLEPGGDPNEIARQIEADIDTTDTVIILGDLEGGSVCNAALRLTVRPNVTLIAGTNLALALQVVLSSPEANLDDEIEEARKRIKKLKLKVSAVNDVEGLF